MRTLLLILFSYTTMAQQLTPQAVYSRYTRLGMNGPLKTVTTFKYTRLKYKDGKEADTKGILYSVIKNEYDTLGRIIRDSNVTFINRNTAVGYCRDYIYTIEDSTSVILITTHFDCYPPYDNHATVETITELTTPDKNTVLAREYDGTTLPRKRSKPMNSYRFLVEDTLIQKTVFDAYNKGVRHYGNAIYLYDGYGNFTQTNLTVGEVSKEEIKHKVLKIDDYGNAIHMLNFINNEREPDFMTKYEFEYYE